MPEYIRWEVVQNLNRKMQEQQLAAEDSVEVDTVNSDGGDLNLTAETQLLSRQKRQFPVFGFLSFLMLIVNSVLLINENININNNNNYEI